MTALRVRPGDLVHVRGAWREVRHVRDDRFLTGGAAVILLFHHGAPLRVRAGDLLAVRR
ncbi:hypothetical protein [Streptomyces sp. NPDC089919]|uniref:hypothetical protein n=1 Tax=Streptomyces sp. NPDC089919 TaxID=3155188 RepID=UPI003415A4B5